MALEPFLLGLAKILAGLVRPVSDWLAQRRRGPAERLRHVLALKDEVAKRLPPVLAETNGDVVLRELRRNDSYPALDESLRAISPWFKAELKGTYYNGIEVFLRVEHVVVAEGVARSASDGSARGRNVFIVGRIPYAAIEGIDWRGDEFYGFTHIYCRFRGWRGRRGPHESIVLYEIEPHEMGGRRFYERIEGVSWKVRRRGLVRRWRDRRALRA